MRHLQLIWQDIKARRNIELYVTIVLSVAVALAGILGFDNQQFLASATLATLALVTYSLLEDRRSNQLPFVISADDQTNVDYICEYIEAHKITRAKLIQYSGIKVTKVVEKLLEKGVMVELLVQHPSAVPSSPSLKEFQLTKMAAFQTAIHDFKNRQNLLMRFYQEPASLRATKLDNVFLAMGWYTYRSESISNKSPWLYGHNNVTINARLNRGETRDLVGTFDAVFQSLWDNALSEEDGKSELRRLLQEQGKNDEE